MLVKAHSEADAKTKLQMQESIERSNSKGQMEKEVGSSDTDERKWARKGVG